MSRGDPITRDEAVVGLAELWERDAETYRRYDPEHPTARVLSHCAEELRRVADEHRAEWVPLAQVRERTGWSQATLRRRAEELESSGKARKDARRGVWEIRRDAAAAIPRKSGPPDGVETAEDLAELGRILGRES